MSVIEFEVKLFDTTGLAADGSNIPRRSCEAYLQSPDYVTIVKDKVAIGGVTHKDRRLKPELKGLVGMDDQVLINNNATHYITGLYFKPGDNFFYAEAKTFDPELFAGDRSDNIKNLIGMLQTGVRMPISVVIQALWSKRGTAEKIIRIKGFDFTQNPSFKGAGDIHLFSETIEDQTQVELEELREFSDSLESGELQLLTKVFSSDGTVTVLDDHHDINHQDITVDQLFNAVFSNKYEVSYFDVVSSYGQSSIQAKMANKFQGRTFSKADLIDNPATESQVEYSIITTLEQRLDNADKPNIIKIDNIIKTYTQYNKIINNEKDRKDMIMLFVQDINLLIKEVSDEIYKGRTLNNIYNLSRYGVEVKSISDALSVDYKKLLLSKKSLGFMPKLMYNNYIELLYSFYITLIKLVFGVEVDKDMFKSINLE